MSGQVLGIHTTVSSAFSPGATNCAIRVASVVDQIIAALDASPSWKCSDPTAGIPELQMRDAALGSREYRHKPLTAIHSGFSRMRG